MSTFSIIIIVAICLVIALVILWLLLRKFYRKASSEMAFVRTGLGGKKVIINNGAIVIPVLHEVISVNMKTLRLEVMCTNNQSLITHDRMRVDVKVEFYFRVKPTMESVADAAQSLGRRTIDAKAMQELVEGKFVDALRAVAAEMDMDEIHEKRIDFVRKVQTAVSEHLLNMGLELESASLSALDQTDQAYFNPQNAFDAQGLAVVTEIVQSRMRRRNEVERDNEVEMRKKNIEAERHKLNLDKEEEFAKLENQREIEVRRAEHEAYISGERAEKEREAKEAEIAAKQQVDNAQILAERSVEEQRIARELFLREKEIDREGAIEIAEIKHQKDSNLADQDRAIAIATKSKEKSIADLEADKERMLAIKAEEQVTTTRQVEVAERQKAIELIEARKKAEHETISSTTQAEVRKSVAIEEAERVRIISKGEADKVRMASEAESNAEIVRAQAADKRYSVDAKGTRALHEAENILDPDKSVRRVKMAIIEHLSEIIRESVKPMEAIESIKIVDVGGLNLSAGGGGDVHAGKDSPAGSGGNLADQLVNSALRYRGQAPLIDSILKEIGITGGDIKGLTAAIKPDANEQPMEKTKKK